METKDNQIYHVPSTPPIHAFYLNDVHQSDQAVNQSTYDDGAHGVFYEYLYYTEHLYEIFDFETPLYGYVWPALVIYTAICNLIVIGGFFRKHMRNPTTIILVAIAISDSLTGLVTLPATFHIFSSGNTVLSKEWCETVMITRYFISRAFHTVSVWETLLLGIHGLIRVRYPVIANRFCTMRKTVGTIVAMYVLSVSLHMYHATDIKAADGLCRWNIEEPCGWSCVYLWCTLLLSHLIPSIVLVVLAVYMIRSFHQFDSTATSTGYTICKKKEKTKRVAKVILLIVIIFIVPELPYGVFYLVTVSLRHSGENILPLRTNRLIHCVYELLLVLSFHVNFWVYCVMFQGFRNCIKRLLHSVTCHKVFFARLECNSASSEKQFELNDETTTAFELDKVKYTEIPHEIS